MRTPEVQLLLPQESPGIGPLGSCICPTFLQKPHPGLKEELKRACEVRGTGPSLPLGASLPPLLAQAGIG